MSDAVISRVERLEELTIDLIEVHDLFSCSQINIFIILVSSLSSRRSASSGMVGLQKTTIPICPSASFISIHQPTMTNYGP